MEIRNKIYPYPVIVPNGYYHNNSQFDVQIRSCSEEQILKFEFAAQVSNNEIQKLIAERKCAYVYHFECAQTSFRTVNISFDEHTVVKVKKDKVSGRLEICPFVVAMQDIQSFSSTDFNADYAGLSFNLEKGCVLAVGKQCGIDIIQDQDVLRNIKSIFTVVKNTDLNSKEMVVDVLCEYITILLPDKEYKLYNKLNSENILKEVLNSLFIVPALMIAINKVILTHPSDRDSTLGDFNWYRSLVLVFKRHYSINLDDVQLSDGDVLKYAQLLADNPLERALDYLAYSEHYEGDEQ